MNKIALVRRFKLGLCVNPFAGIGGALAFKGSDGAEVRNKALAAGAQRLAIEKTKIALAECSDMFDDIDVYTGAGDLGENIVKALGLNYKLVYQAPNTQTESDDSVALAKAIAEEKVDILMFAGGDGTARNICEAVGQNTAVLGVPSGCKIHSGVFAITPKAAGIVLKKVLLGELLSLRLCEVRDIDEHLFRLGKVQSKYYGEMSVPSELDYIQAVKMGGKESDELVLDDIADYIIELMQEHPQSYFVMGSGSTVDAIMQKLQLPNTLLGVDIVKDGQLYANDVNANFLCTDLADKSCKLVLTVIGGQGHILGRGNQQLSPEFIRQIGRQNILVVATKTKLKSLLDRGLVSDSGDPSLDKELAGPISITTGYNDQVLYFVKG